jgi:heat shock protein HtpX
VLVLLFAVAVNWYIIRSILAFVFEETDCQPAFFLFDAPSEYAALTVLALILLAASPIGDIWGRLWNGCRKPTAEEMRRLSGAFARARPPEGCTLWVTDDDRPDAFAVGRSVAVSVGFMRAYGDDELAAVLAHEVAHVRYGDGTRFLIRRSVEVPGNVALALVTAIVGSVVSSADDSGEYECYEEDSEQDSGVPVFIFLPALVAFIVLWPVCNLLRLLAAFDSRRTEYRADRYARDIGLGEPLARVLEREGDFEGGGLFDSHPPTRERVERLRRPVRGCAC